LWKVKIESDLSYLATAQKVVDLRVPGTTNDVTATAVTSFRSGWSFCSGSVAVSSRVNFDNSRKALEDDEDEDMLRFINKATFCRPSRSRSP
jgi:hypothetical protein